MTENSDISEILLNYKYNDWYLKKKTVPLMINALSIAGVQLKGFLFLQIVSLNLHQLLLRSAQWSRSPVQTCTCCRV